MVVLAAAAAASCSTARADAPALSSFGSLPETQFAALSPNGRLVAIDEVRNDTRRIVVFDATTGKTVRTIMSDDNNKLRALTWSDDETLLVEASIQHTADCANERRCSVEWFRTLAFRMDGKAPLLLLNDEGARRYVSGSHLRATHTTRPGSVTMSTWDYFANRQRQSTGSHLQQSDRELTGWASIICDVDTRTGTDRLLATGTQYTQDWVVDGQGQPVARSEWDADRHLYTIVARQGNSWKEVLRRDDGTQFNLAGLDPDGKVVIALGADGGALSQAWAVPLDGSPIHALHSDPLNDFDGYHYDWNRNAVVAVMTSSGAKVEWLDPTLGSQWHSVAKAFPGRTVEIVNRSTDNQKVLVKVSSRSVPPVYELVDFTAGKADIVAEQYPSLADAKLGTVEFITYPARDGPLIPAFLTTPPGAQAGSKLPLVVLPHGGPEARDADAFDWLSQFLSTRGYAVLRPQFRGSTGFGEAFRLAGYREWGGLMQDDVTDGVQKLISDGTVDPKKICIVGASYGGYSALAGAAFTPDLYACAASIAGVSDLPQVLIDMKLDRNDSALYYWHEHIGPTSDPRLAARSPARFAANVQAPVLLIHGVDDSVVPIRQSEMMWHALDRAGKRVTFVRLDGEDHWLSRSATRTRVLEELDRFLAQYLH
jgi:dipeptidyl aminopeptidase/acylaminoacyl peptidase